MRASSSYSTIFRGSWPRLGQVFYPILVSFLLGSVQFSFADSVKFTAEVDRTEISVDESVTLKLTVQSEAGSVGEPQYSSPGFELLNQYNAVRSESFYDESTGHIGMHNSFEINRVLKPTRTGQFKISGIHVTVGGQVYHASDITIDVGSGGAGTPPPRGYGGGGVGLHGAGKRSSLPSVFVRAEVDKSKVYKGEQVVVSYYLYQRARAFNIEITKFPSLNGFLREELEMPYLNRKLEMEQIVLDGVAYARALLVRYAAYPLQDGKLEIDEMDVKYNYYNANGFDAQDPFAGLFKQALPGNSHSDVLKVEVKPLPEAGKPVQFSGGVGDFEIVSAIDKTEVHANQPVSLVVKVEGRGNVATLQEPKAKWPETVELYDTKGTVKAGKGTGQKTFEFLLIPRQPGPLELPSLEISYFDTRKGEYVTKKTEPLKITVQDPLPGTSAYVSKPRSQSQGQGASSPQAGLDGISQSLSEPKGLKAPGEPSFQTEISGLPVWRLVYRLSIAAFAVFVMLVGKDGFLRLKSSASEKMAARAKAESKSWTRIRSRASRLNSSDTEWPEVLQFYDLVASQVHDAIDRIYSVGSRSYSREELQRMLVEERGMPEETWKLAARVLEFAELVRFATSAGAVSENAARLDAEKWVSEAENVTRMIQENQV